MCSALVTLQTKIPRAITVPDMSTVDDVQVQQWVDAATLLCGGEIIGTWAAFGFVRADTRQELSLPSWVRVTESLTVNILERKWEVGHIDRIGKAAAWTWTDQHAGRGVLAPGSDTTMRVRLASDPDAPNRQAHRTVAFAPITE